MKPGFESACNINANLSQLAQTLKPQNGVDRVYFATKFDVGITFGATELKAFIQWDENVRVLSFNAHTRWYTSLTSLTILSLTGRQEARTRHYYTRRAGLTPIIQSISMSTVNIGLEVCTVLRTGSNVGLFVFQEVVRAELIEG